MKRSRIKEYFSNKSPEQVFSLCLLGFTVATMLFCLIVRLCGSLYFTADLTAIKEPSRLWQEVIMGILLTFELTFVYKILCKKGWAVCIGISVAETLLGILIGFLTRNLKDGIGSSIVSIFYLFCYMFIPLVFIRKWWSLIDSAVLYVLQLLYSVIFMVGRIGKLDSLSFNFICNVVGCIDYKLFIVAMYLVIYNFGGIRLWKNQKRLILIKSLPK